MGKEEKAAEVVDSAADFALPVDCAAPVELAVTTPRRSTNIVLSVVVAAVPVCEVAALWHRLCGVFHFFLCRRPWRWRSSVFVLSVKVRRRTPVDISGPNSCRLYSTKLTLPTLLNFF